MFRKQKNKRKSAENGFSIIELIIVLLVISILSILAVMSFKSEKKYLADTQAFQINDILHEARQRALSQRETMRVEINKTRNTVRLISENEPGDAADDQEIRSIKLEAPAVLVVDAPPQNVSGSPSEMSPTPAIIFKASTHPLSIGDTVATLRFTTTGKVLDAGSNSIGTNSAMTGATIYIWSPEYSDAGQPLASGNVIRAITVQGTSGITGYWKCPVANSNCKKWIQ